MLSDENSKIVVKFPFSISQGRVAMLTSESDTERLDMARSRIMFCLGTQVGERVMRPSWGLDIFTYMSLFQDEPDYENAVGADGKQQITNVLGTQAAIRAAFDAFLPEYRLVKVDIFNKPGDDQTVIVDVKFQLRGEAEQLIDNVQYEQSIGGLR